MTTMGWPNNKSEIQRYYPLSIMETGSDILFFWVARMMMLCNHFTGIPPFKSILLHPLIRDAKGRKMSKSIGNVIDPIHVIEGRSLDLLLQDITTSNITDKNEIKKAMAITQSEYPKGIEECGTDALRFSLIQYTEQGRNINLDINRVVAYRKFCNKIWNATKYAISNLDNFEPENINAIRDHLHLNYNKYRIIDKWILSRLSNTIEQCNNAFESLNLCDATTSIYSFFLYDYCDIYLEFSKFLFYKKYTNYNEIEYVEYIKQLQHVHLIILDSIFRLLHPFMPFITEELWQHLPLIKNETSIMLSSYPQLELSQFKNQFIETQMKVTNDHYNL